MNINDAISPLDELFQNQLPNIIMGMRLAETIETFPEPTIEEQKLQWILNFHQEGDFSSSKAQYKKWLLLRGFEDIHKAISESLRQVLIYGKTRNEGPLSIQQQRAIRKLHYPDLVEQVQTIYGTQFTHEKEMLSLNTVRNALVHDNGIAVSTRLNKGEKKLTIYGGRPILFFQDGEIRIPAEIGKPGPENSGLYLGGEKFQIEFSVGDPIELSLKEFIDIVLTCIYIKTDIQLLLNSGQ